MNTKHDVGHDTASAGLASCAGAGSNHHLRAFVPIVVAGCPVAVAQTGVQPATWNDCRQVSLEDTRVRVQGRDQTSLPC